MKRLAALILAALMLLTVFASAASAAAANETLQIRGPVYNGSTLTDILSKNGGTLKMDASQFAAFFYDIDNNVTTETLSIISSNDNKERTIGKNALVYQTTIGNTDYKYADWGNYSVLGFFADKYIPLKSNDASKLAKLVKDSDEKITLKTGEKTDLGQGYALEAKQVDVDGKKVWLEFTKDGEYVDDQIISTDGKDSTWTCELDKIQGEDNVPVLKVHVNQVFQGAVDSIAQIDGIWLIDYANAMKIESDAEFGKLNKVSLSGPTITITNDDTMTLSRDSDVEIGQGMYFKVADSNDLRFYAYKEITEPGTYQVRGTVATGPQTWTADNFAGFFYDLKKNVATESLKVSNLKGNVIQKSGLEYSTTIKNVDYKSKDFNGSYPVLGFFAEEYVPLKANDASKLAKLVKDSDDKITLKTGEKTDLGQGYALEAKQVDVDGKKVWLEFTKDGEYVDDQIVSTDSGSKVWTCELDKIQGEDNVPVLKVHVNQVFQGAVDSIAQLDGVWLIDYANAMKIESDAEFGKLNKVSISGPTLTITNDDTFTLSRDSQQEIGQGMYFKIADTPVDQLRYYPYVEKTIGGGVTTPAEEGNVTKPTENVTNVTKPTENVTNETGNVTEATTEENVTTTTEENKTAAPTEAANKTGEKGKTPGFGVIGGIVGLVAVIYFVRRND
jgi:S-layer protein (TIGR01567 family)